MLRLTETRGSRSWPGRLPGVPEPLDLLGLQVVERHAGVLGEQRRAHQVHALFAPPIPPWRRIRRPTRSARAAPATAARSRSRPGGLANIGRGLGCGEALALQHLEEHLGVCSRAMSASVVALGRARNRSSASRRSTCSGDPRLMPSCRRPPEIRSAAPGVLRHVERVLVAHVDHAGADLDAAGPRADRGEQRERRGELLGEVVHAEVRAVGAELLGGDRQLDRLQQRVRGRAHLRLPGRRPVPERQEPDLLHDSINPGGGGGIPAVGA